MLESYEQLLYARDLHMTMSYIYTSKVQNVDNSTTCKCTGVQVIGIALSRSISYFGKMHLTRNKHFSSSCTLVSKLIARYANYM